MTPRIGLWITVLVLLAGTQAVGQTQPYRGPANDPRQPGFDPRQPSVPYQALPPVAPTIRPRRPPQPPFMLSPQQQAQVDWVLKRWEQESNGVKSFDCSFTRFEYDTVFGEGNKPKFTDSGRIWYAAPDKGRFEVHGERAEKWICDGKAIYEYSFLKRQLIQHDLPPEMQGKAIADGPLPFLFGAKAESLKQRYFLRLIAPPQGAEGQVWLEAFPATQQGLANFKKAEMILSTEGMRPFALQIYLPNGNRTAYRFTDLKINARALLPIFSADPFRAEAPKGWQTIVEPAPVARGRVSPPTMGSRPTGVRQ